MSTEAAVCSHQDVTRKSVSSTAHGAAEIRAIESALDPNIRLFHDPYAAALSGEVGKQFMDQRESTKASILDRCAVRTKKIDDEMTKAVNVDSFKQICVLGAGLDSRAWRLQKTTKHPVHFFEVDFQEIFDFKLPVLEKEKARSPFAYHSVAADLSIDSWPEALLAAGFDPTVPTLFLLEGFINYLTHEEAGALMNRLRHQLAAPGSRIVATLLTARTPRRPTTHRFFPEDPLVFLGEHGWTGVQTEIDELAKDYGRDTSHQEFTAYYIVVVE